ncbi:MAG: cyclic nucleotide-binding domain-containing protein [Saprospiraceae bacterium]
MRDTVIHEILKINPSISSEEIEYGLEYFEEKEFDANSLILETGNVCKHLFIAESSITRCYYFDNDGAEQTLWMKPEQTFIAEFKSFSTQTKSQFSLQLYETTPVWMISRENLMKLYQKSPNWALFGI